MRTLTRVTTRVAIAAALIAAPSHADETTPAELPPCVYEDGPAPCVWDADTRGNGRGTDVRHERNGR